MRTGTHPGSSPGQAFAGKRSNVTKKCGPGQTRRLTGTAGARDLATGGPDQTLLKARPGLLRANDKGAYPQAGSNALPPQWFHPSRRLAEPVIGRASSRVSIHEMTGGV